MRRMWGLALELSIFVEKSALTPVRGVSLMAKGCPVGIDVDLGRYVLSLMRGGRVEPGCLAEAGSGRSWLVLESFGVLMGIGLFLSSVTKMRDRFILESPDELLPPAFRPIFRWFLDGCLPPLLLLVPFL